MLSNYKLDSEDEKIINELDNLCGVVQNKEVLRDIIIYIKLKQNNKLDFGNYNIIIRNNSSYNLLNDLLKVCSKVFIKYNIIENERICYLDKIINSRRDCPFDKISGIEDSIIVISGEMDMLLKLRSNRYLHSFVDKVSGYEKILKEINDLINIKEVEKSSIEYRIHQELKKLNYNFSYVGTKYIIEALLIIYNNYQFDNVKLEKDIYPKISKKYKKSINNIKTNIINATDLMYYDCNSEVLKKYLRILDDTKPTPKIIMSVILEKLIYKD